MLTPMHTSTTATHASTQPLIALPAAAAEAAMQQGAVATQQSPATTQHGATATQHAAATAQQQGSAAGPAAGSADAEAGQARVSLLSRVGTRNYNAQLLEWLNFLSGVKGARGLHR